MVECYVQWAVTRFVRDSFASKCATVFNWLVGVPNAMISGEEKKCAWSWGWDERKYSGSYATLCCIPGNTSFPQVSVLSMCNNLYGIIVILFHGIPGIKTCTCAYVTHNSERFVRDLFTQWTPVEITTHSTRSILLCFMHVFIFLFMFSRQY